MLVFVRGSCCRERKTRRGERCLKETKTGSGVTLSQGASDLWDLFFTEFSLIFFLLLGACWWARGGAIFFLTFGPLRP